MTKPFSEQLREYADLLDTNERLGNVERVVYKPSRNQRLLLALHSGTSEDNLPDTGTVRDLLKQRLVKVQTPLGQSAVLGLFYTRNHPLQPRTLKPTPALFPLYDQIDEYVLTPRIKSYDIGDATQITIVQENTVEDPYMAKIDDDVDILLYRQSPFSDASGHYATEEPVKEYPLKPYEYSLEANVITRALWVANDGINPLLFRTKGFKRFIQANKNDPAYAELYDVYKRQPWKN